MTSLKSQKDKYTNTLYKLCTTEWRLYRHMQSYLWYAYKKPVPCCWQLLTLLPSHHPPSPWHPQLLRAACPRHVSLWDTPCHYHTRCHIVTVRSWGRIQTLNNQRGWCWHSIVSLLNSITKYTCQKCLRASQADIIGHNHWKSGITFVSRLVGHPRTWALKKFKTSWNSLLWQAIAVFHPDKVGQTEFMQELAYVTASRHIPTA
jgi:hypothetical protein